MYASLTVMAASSKKLIVQFFERVVQYFDAGIITVTSVQWRIHGGVEGGDRHPQTAAGPKNCNAGNVFSAQ